MERRDESGLAHDHRAKVARMTPARVGIAVVGAGLATAPYWTSLQELAHLADVRWLVGKSVERVERVRRDRFPDARATADLGQALADPHVQAVLLLTPPSTHLELGLRCAEAGRHVLIEKPVGLATEETLRLIETFEARGLHFGVMLQHRLRAAAVALKRAVDAGALGRLTSAAVDVRWWRPQSYYDEPGRGSRARDGGGVLLTQAIHTLDLFLHIVGVPSQVFAFAETSAAHTMECEDVVTAVARLAQGGIATVNATTAAYPGFAERIEISGTQATACLSAGRLDIQFLDGSRETEGDAESLGAGADPMDFSHHAHCAVIADFLWAVGQGRAPAVTGRSALAVRRFIDAILESAQSAQLAEPTK